MICWYPEWLKTWSTYLFLGFFKTVDSQTHTELHGMRCDLAPHREELGTRETGKLNYKKAVLTYSVASG